MASFYVEQFMQLKLFSIVMTGLALATTAANAGEVVQKWEVDGVERQAIVFVPDTAKGEPAPVMFAFHGHGGSMRASATRFKYQQLWPEAIVIYPQGLPTPGRLTDPEGKKAGWQGRVGDQNDRDLKFFDAMLKWARDTYKVDDKCIYCTGHSNGGGFTYLLWGQRGDVFAAMAPACAPAAAPNEFKPKPVLHIAGTKDPLVKYAWQQATIDVLRKVNGCDAEGKPAGENLTLYASSSGTPVETYIYDGGHTPPNNVWAVVVTFFKEHPGK